LVYCGALSIESYIYGVDGHQFQRQNIESVSCLSGRSRINRVTSDNSKGYGKIKIRLESTKKIEKLSKEILFNENKRQSMPFYGLQILRILEILIEIKLGILILKGQEFLLIINEDS
jgi:hypothetical protein